MKLKVTKHNRKYLHLGFVIEFILIGVFISSVKATPQPQEQFYSQETTHCQD